MQDGRIMGKNLFDGVLIRRAAMDYLARREHSEKELFNKLRVKGFPEEAIQSVLAALIQENLLSQDRFIENYIHFRRAKGFGPIRIHAELTQRGISEELIDHHLKIADNAWFDHVQDVWRKRFKNEMPRDMKTRAKQMRFLYARGFTIEQINRVFEE